jgi:Carboxypeptidase regulatory-like domain
VTGSQRVRVAAVVVARTLTGVITDDSTGRPITGQAEAQIMDGENAGKAGRVDANGTYSIPDAVAGTFILRARATGYESRDLES